MKLFNPVSFTNINSQNCLLVITPSAKVAASICAFKDEAKLMIGYFHSFNQLQITVNYHGRDASFRAEKLMYYDQKLQQEKPVTLKVCGFDFSEYQNSYTIYAKVELDEAVKEPDSGFEKLAKLGVPNVPHIIIARSLSAKNFETLWTYFENLPFECFFYADKIAVLELPFCTPKEISMQIKTELHLKNAV